MNEILTKIQEYALEAIMADRFSKYAKEIILDRAIPDVRDGLKPVQRRILYAMNRAGHTFNKPYVKCAAIVGDVLGQFHPHGDSSIYDALVRMSQWWKQNYPLIDIHGNNGSMDGDPAAAYRYTEARLAVISNELLKDLAKDTVAWSPNFDDRLWEPTVLPARFPNLLVNGASGISAGYATNIPPHNLGEVIDAAIKRIEAPNCRLDSILALVKGPDFPTGGIVAGGDGIKEALTTGKGRVIVSSKYHIESQKSKVQIIITEIPFEVNKAVLVNHLDAIRIDKKIEGILEVRDESNREGLRIVIDLKKEANQELIVNYLMKNTEMQTAYNYNMVAIVNNRPLTLGIIPILDAYLAHQKEVIKRRTAFDLANFRKRLHLVMGFLKMISILDQVIAVIRASSNKADAEINLVQKFNFSPEQAEAIVVLQLYRLTNTDVGDLENEKASLTKYISAFESILNDEEKLKKVMKHELKKIKATYQTPRKTEIKAEIETIKIDHTDLISKENVVVVVTHEGYIKRVSMKSFGASKNEETLLKPGDLVTGRYELTTLDQLLLITNQGNYLRLPVYKIPESKWKEMGQHLNNIINLASNEQVITSLIYQPHQTITLITQKGMIKQTKLKDLTLNRSLKPTTVIKLKPEDKLIGALLSKKHTLLVTNKGYYLNILTDTIPILGPKAKGVIGIKLQEDSLVGGLNYQEEEYLNIFTNHDTAKRIKLSELKQMKRAQKGNRLIKQNKTITYLIKQVLITNSKDSLLIKNNEIVQVIKNSIIPILDFQSNGSKLNQVKFDFVSHQIDLTSYLEPNQTSNLTDFIDDFKI